MSGKGYLGPGHPLAVVAERLCAKHVGAAQRGLIGGTACGACWEQAIRADERAVVVWDLPSAAPAAEPGFVDAIAVEVAARGSRPVALTAAEQLAAVALLLSWGLTHAAIGDRLALSDRTVERLVRRLRGAAAVVEDSAGSAAA